MPVKYKQVTLASKPDYVKPVAHRPTNHDPTILDRSDLSVVLKTHGLTNDPPPPPTHTHSSTGQRKLSHCSLLTTRTTGRLGQMQNDYSVIGYIC